MAGILTSMRWVSLALLLSLSTAYAQPKKKADDLFERGRKLMAAGNYSEACSAFEESQQLESAVTTLLNLGACREKLQQLASAVAVFRAAERTARREGSPTSTQLADIAEGHIKRLEPKLSLLTIQVPRASRLEGLVIERNGVPVEAALWDVPVPLDGGTYKIVAKASGHESWDTSIKLGVEKDSKAIRVPALAEGGEAEPEPVQDPPVDTPKGGGGGGRSFLWPVVFGVGAVAAGTGAFLMWRKGDEIYDESKDEPDPQRQDRLWDDANRHRYIAEGLIAVGVGCAAVSIILLVRGGGSSTTDRQVTIEPTARGDGMVIGWGGAL